ncbi:hypothetical protein HMPREF3214_00942 [Alloscardovia omnicolens]|nr:hypothetical protein HMPREF3214_00942 [Alloscardovia omnicolens]
MTVLMRKNGFKTVISVARIDFTYEAKPHSHRSDVLTHNIPRNQLEPTGQCSPLNPAKITRARKTRERTKQRSREKT